MNREIYLDNNATTKPLEEVRAAMMETLGDGFGNPSSFHVAGDRGRDCLRNSRNWLGQLLEAEPDAIVFTSSGTEANNMVLLSAATRACSKKCRIVTTRTEHSSVLRSVEHLQSLGVEVVIVPVDRDGFVDLDELHHVITDDTSLVSVQWINNETGVIQPIEQIGELCQAHGVPFHTDACQAVGKIPVDVSRKPIDLLTLTAHKLHGPQGVGAIYSRNKRWLTPLLFGGPQESDLRAGTENLPGIVGFGRAAVVRHRHLDAIAERLTRLRDQFENRVRELVPDVTVNGNPDRRVCNTTNLCFHGIDGQALVAQLDLEGVRCSQSSACTNRQPEPSYVLRAMGLSEEDAYASARFSFGVFNTEEEIECAAQSICTICRRLRSFAAKLQDTFHVART